MGDQFGQIAGRLSRLEDDINRLKAQQFSLVVPLTTHVRVLDDLTPRVAVYGPNNLTIVSVGGLPANITGVWYQLFATGNGAANAFSMQVYDPDSGVGPVRMAGKLVAAGDQITGAGFVKLGAASGANPGQLTYTLGAGNYSRFIIDIVAYLV